MKRRDISSTPEVDIFLPEDALEIHQKMGSQLVVKAKDETARGGYRFYTRHARKGIIVMGCILGERAVLDDEGRPIRDNHLKILTEQVVERFLWRVPS